MRADCVLFPAAPAAIRVRERERASERPGDCGVPRAYTLEFCHVQNWGVRMSARCADREGWTFGVGLVMEGGRG